MVSIKRFDTVRDLIGSIVIRFYNGLEELINDNDFGSIDGTCYKFHKIGLK